MPDQFNRAASHQDAEEFASNLNKAQLECRAYGHLPRPVGVPSIVTMEGSRKKYYEISWRCRNRCGVTWTQLIEVNTGIQVYRRANYSAAKGYLAQGIGRIDATGKGAIRLEAFSRNFSSEESE